MDGVVVEQKKAEHVRGDCVDAAVLERQLGFVNICFTRSYAALRAADLDWIIGPGYSSGGYILGENHEKPEASPPDSRLSNSRSSGEDGEPPSPSDEGDGPRRSPSPNRRAPAPPRRPHQDVPSRRTVEPVSRKKSH